MVAPSKPTLLTYTCYELGHTWTPSCTKASFDVAKDVSKEAFKIYGSLYLIAAIVRRKGKKYFRDKFWRELAQSTLFLTTNGTLFITCFCIWRKLAGFYFYPNAILLGIPACGISLSIERKERRGLLAMYTGNLALETVWRMLKARGWVKSIPNGEVLMFSVATAIYLYYFKKQNGLPSGTESMFKMVFGSIETLPEKSDDDEDDMETEQEFPMSRNGPGPGARSTTRSHPALNMVAPLLRAVEPMVSWLKHRPSHPVCQHKHSCAFYVIQGAVRMFGIGYGVQAVIKLLSSLPGVFKRPKTVISALMNKANVQLGAFLASLVGIYRALNCVLRWLRDRDDSLHGLVAGFVAGWSMMYYKSSTIALYTASKVAEMMYFKGIAVGKLPYIQCADIILYSISTSIVFHAAVLEPHNLRPAYWKFLMRVTGNKFAGMNRRLLDPYITNCSKLYPDYWPDYDMRFTNLVKPPAS
ncbi:transmembrane protein 135-like isoform X2 [Mya arenaria]|uniref:transmembrane protein 135-like isoform X2 n=1 Tax=Mya arenaria TaxID=6604 RepID=UPI0022E3BCAA|nr:transmembrane protein 135-like isoform X2 [Mya arenaria]